MKTRHSFTSMAVADGLAYFSPVDLKGTASILLLCKEAEKAKNAKDTEWYSTALRCSDEFSKQN